MRLFLLYHDTSHSLISHWHRPDVTHPHAYTHSRVYFMHFGVLLKTHLLERIAVRVIYNECTQVSTGVGVRGQLAAVKSRVDTEGMSKEYCEARISRSTVVVAECSIKNKIGPACFAVGFVVSLGITFMVSNIRS